MYLERKILSKLHGDKYFDFDAAIGWNHLKDDIDHFGATNPLTALVPVLTDTDPDDVHTLGLPCACNMSKQLLL